MKLLILATVLILSLFTGCIETPEAELDFDNTPKLALCNLEGIEISAKSWYRDTVVINKPPQITLTNGETCVPQTPTELHLNHGTEVGQNPEWYYHRQYDYVPRYKCSIKEIVEDGVIVQKGDTYLITLQIDGAEPVEDFSEENPTLILHSAICEKTEY